MDHSPLARLPAELRNTIFEMAMQSPHDIKLDAMWLDEPSLRHQPSMAPALTCRQLYRETRPLFFSCNDFTLIFEFHPHNGLGDDVRDLDRATDGLGRLAAWFKSIGPDNAKCVQSVRFRMPQYECHNASQGLLYTMGFRHDWFEFMSGRGKVDGVLDVLLAQLGSTALCLDFKIRYSWIDVEPEVLYNKPITSSTIAVDLIEAAMDKSPLSLLPGELRNPIFELALHEPDDIVLETAQGKLTAPANTLASARTCRQLRNETHEMFFNYNNFAMKCYYFSYNSTCYDVSSIFMTAAWKRMRWERVQRKLEKLLSWVETNCKAAARRMGSIRLDLGDVLVGVDPTADPHDYVAWKRAFSEAIVGLTLSMIDSGWYDWDVLRPALQLSFVVHICIAEYTAEVAYDLPLNDAVEVRRRCQAAVDAERGGTNTGLLAPLFEQDVVVPVLEDVMQVLRDAPKTRLLCFR
ncbi:hypothetical protein LTR56_025118 [Elasticomyces elasticus]|nr:hypothetical protein LTR56_025118 [Elasticomyces elasticus]KAK4919803.1 hypothetical protein LTR49_012550 [Elasticomyces elasticus]KAK5741140.1 hypothetical protein LTS12_024694 [Elasticomyces elasticus]